ncbi:MAG: hypothetical protein NTY35_04495 [Planctomycetota bacterium]|nr:hypothetical protein [Planctomycetota bacterium]
MSRLLLGALAAALSFPSFAPIARAQSAIPATDRGAAVEQAIANWRVQHGSSWRTLLHGDTGRLEFLYGGSAAPSRAPIADAEFVGLALEAIEATRDMHGIAAGELTPSGVHFLPLAQIGSTDKISVEFTQSVGGLPVSAGTVHCLFDMRGRLLSLHAQGVPDADRLELEPLLDATRARALAASAFAEDESGPATQVGQAQLEITRVGGGALAWRVEARSEIEGAMPAGRVYWVGARDGSILASERTVHEFEVRGNVRALVTPGLAPDTASNSVVPVPMRYMNVSSSAGTVRTDALGNFVFPSVNTSLAVTLSFTGPYNNVQNVAGAEYTLTQTIPANQDNTLTMNPSSSAQITAQGNTFHHINLLRDFVRSINPTDATADVVLSSNVNLNQTCNAYFDGGSTNYFLAGGSCANTAYSTVVGHENGHWLNVRYGTGNGMDGMGEGNADVWAMYLYDSPVVGLDFCGPGCNVRTGLNTRPFCGDNSPQCYGEVHADGETWMGAAWKVRARLNTALGNAMGDLTANTLFLAWMNAYNQGTIRSIIETQWLVLDDDDGDLNDGSPHYPQIDGGFREQGFPGVALNPVTIDGVTLLPDSTVEVGPYGVEARIIAHFDNASLSGATLYWRVNGSVYTPIPLVPQGGDLFGNAIPIVPTPAQVDYYVVAVDSLGNSLRWPGPAAVEGFRVGAPVALWSTDFESGAAGWTHGTYGDTSNQGDDWQLGTPAGKFGSAAVPGQIISWRDPASAWSGASCWGVDLGNGSNGTYSTNVHTWLRSPSIDCTNARGVQLSFRRWLSVQYGSADQARIRVNGNIVWSNPTATNLLEQSWTAQVVDISPFADGNPSVQVEFEIRTDASVQLGGWNVDQVELTQLGPATNDCVAPTAYGPAKVHSGSSIARLESAGETSLLFGPFQLSLVGGVPQRSAMVYSSHAPAATPMLGGTLLIAQPFARELAWQLDGFGEALSTYTVQPSQVGTTRYFQCVFRDPANPDGTGIGFSKALRVSFCP